MLGINFALNFSSNTAMFTRGISGANAAFINFTQSFKENSEAMRQNFGFGTDKLEEIKSKIVSATEQMGIFGESLGAEFIKNKTLAGVAGSLGSIEENLKRVFSVGNGENKFQTMFDDLNKNVASMDLKSMDIFTKSMEEFSTNIKDFSPKQTKAVIDMINALSKEHDPKKTQELVKQIEKITSAPYEETKRKIENVANQVRSFMQYTIGLGTAYSIFTEIIQTQNELARTSWMMGQKISESWNNVEYSTDKAASANWNLRKAVRDTAFDYMKMNAEIATTTQASLSEVGETMSELMKMRVGAGSKTDFKELTETSMLMQKALSMSPGIANEFVKSLSLIGGVGSKDIRVAAQELSNVQQQLGLSDAEAGVVGSTVGSLMRQFKAFGGGSSKDVKVVTKEVAKMTAAFTSVGLEAQDAAGIINKMMDPENVQKSVLLWSSMGMTAAEGFAMMQGEGKNMEGMTAKMVKVAKDLKAQYGGNIYALKAMAEAHGLNLEQVQSLSQYDAKRLKDTKKTVALEEAAAAARQGLTDQLTRIKNSLLVMMQTTLLPILKIIGGIAEAFNIVLTYINKMSTSSNKFVAGLGTALKVLISVGLLAFIMNLKIIGGLTSGIGKNIFGWVGGLKEGVKQAWTFAKNLGQAMKTDGGATLTQKIKHAWSTRKGAPEAKGIEKIGDATSKIDDKAPNKLKGIGEAMKSFPSPKQILAVGAAMLMLAAGIAIIILSITQLVKAVGEAGLSFNQLAGIALILLPVFGGFMGMLALLPPIITAIGAAGSAGAVGILAVGAAFLLMGAGIWLVADGIAKIFLSFEKMGLGIQLIAQNIGVAIDGIKLFKQELGGNWKGISSGVISEIENINIKLNEMNNLVGKGMVADIVTKIQTKITGENDAQKTIETKDYTKTLEATNKHLSAIETNTGRTNDLISTLIKVTKVRRSIELTPAGGAT